MRRRAVAKRRNTFSFISPTGRAAAQRANHGVAWIDPVLNPVW